MTQDETRILVVDDEPFVRSTIKTMLRRIGYSNIDEADDGQTAMTSIVHAKPDVVLLDLNMKPMGGLQLIEQLRQDADQALRELPVVLLTGECDQETVLAAKTLAIAGYLVKPVSPRMLGERLTRILGASGRQKVADSAA